MNKFCRPLDSDPDYKSVVQVIQRFLRTIQTGTPLEQADAWIREKHYDKQRLKIERLSGDPLDMSQCYINLALVEIQKVDNSQPMSEGPSPFSLTERLKLEIPHDDLRVELPDLFQPRKMPGRNTKMPRRILIRGRAGVGKTTLCKKIVYDFIHGWMWQDLFKRVIWIRLRELKSLPNDNYSLERVLKNIFFRQHSQHTFLSDQICNRLCTELWRHIEDTRSRDTLFLLDGLDEVPELTMEYRHGNTHPGHELLKGLLNRPNVIITTRPHATFPSDFRPADLELDTMGFNKDQVKTYIEVVMPRDKETIQAYLEKQRIMQSLVQIPIQLDALCFTWQTSSVWNTVIPETMTAVYEAMVRELWRKDNERLEKDGLQIIGNASPAETDPFDSTQYENLGYLAFSGLCSNVIEFQPHHRNALYRFMKKERTSLSFDETFARLSFWRTSDPSNSLPNQSYHFIHLTFQEYFSAKHFAKAWRCDKDLEYVEFDDQKPKKKVVSCRKFLGNHKFTARYNIMWRFVVGILDEDEAQTSRFFEAIDREPVDMLGPTQQRLVMHCLAEVTESEGVRRRLEDQLSQWLEFELKFRKTSQFIRQPEFPERAINLVLERTSEDNKVLILDKGRNLPFTTLELITGWLERGELSQTLRFAALMALQTKSLPTRTLNAAIALMDDDDQDTRNFSIRVLKYQAPWPEDILRAVMARVEIQDSSTDSGIKERTARALGSHSAIPEALLRRMASWTKDQDPSTTQSVLLTLRRQQGLDEEIIRAIATMLDDRQQEIRVLAFEALEERTELPPNILNNMAIYLEADDFSVEGISTHRDLEIRLSDDLLAVVKRRLEVQDKEIQQRAWKVLQRERKKRENIPFDDVFDILVTWIQGGDNESSRLALTLLVDESELPEGIIEAVRTQQQAQDQEISYLAFIVLLSQKTNHAGVMDKAIDWLKVEDQEERQATLHFLRSKYQLSDDTLRAVAEQLDDQDGTLRETALETLGALGSHEDFPNDVISAITKQVYHVHEATRRAAAKTLAEIWYRQSFPLELLEDIVAKFRNHDTAIRKAASDSLTVLSGQVIFPDRTFDAIAVHLADPDEEIRYTAAKSLRDLSYINLELPGRVVLAIAVLLEDPDSRIRCASVMTLQKLLYGDPFPDHFLRPLAALLNGTDNKLRCETMETLRRLGRRQSFPLDILDLILDQLETPQMENRYLAFAALAPQSGLPEATVEAMVVSGLRDKDRRVQCIALGMIERLPTMSTEIHGLVVGLLDDRSKTVGQEAVKRLVSHGNLSDDMYPAIERLLEPWPIGTGQEVVLESLGASSTLPDEILQAVTRQINSINNDVQWAAMEALRGQHKLPDSIFKTAASYSAWLKRSFEQDVLYSVEEGVSYLELPAGVVKLRLWGQPDELRDTIRERQMELGMPVRCEEIDR